MEKTTLKQILMKTFYLNENQAEIYGLLLIKGILTIGEISLLIKKSQDDCDKLIKDLYNLKLIKIIPGTVIRYQALPPFEGFFAQITRYQKVFEKLNEDISNSAGKLIGDFKNNIKSLMEEIQELFKTHREESTILEKQKEHYNREISEYITEIKDNSANLIKDLNNIFITYLNSFEERINIVKMEVDKNFSEVLIELKDIKAKNNDFLEENLSTLISPQKERMKKLMNILFSILDTSFNSITTDIENLRKELINISSKNGDALINLSADLQNKIITFLSEQFDNLNISIIELKDKILNTENQIQELFSNKNQDLETNLINTLISLHDEIDKSLELLNEKESELMNLFFQNVEEKILEQVKEISEIFDLNKTLFLENTENINKNLKELLTSYLTDYASKSNDLKTKFETCIDDFKNILNEIIKKLNDKMINTITQHRTVNEKSINALEDRLIDGLKQNHDLLETEISNLETNISSEFQNSITGFKENILLL
ncbi:MAG: hypothetical protein ACFFCM_13510, partial [Promethearchaeota archaeon]